MCSSLVVVLGIGFESRTAAGRTRPGGQPGDIGLGPRRADVGPGSDERIGSEAEKEAREPRSETLIREIHQRRRHRMRLWQPMPASTGSRGGEAEQVRLAPWR